MKHYLLNLVIVALAGLLLPMKVIGQHDDKIIADSKNARAKFIKADRLIQSLFNDSYGYAIFPNVGKGAIGIGGAAGNGAVYEKGKLTGMAKMIQFTAGFQFGGQAYREVIFFENKDALEHFKDNKLEFSGQTSAIAAKEGAAANVKYREGVMVFTQGKAGLMVEAAIGGQKFTYEPHSTQ